MTQQMTQQEQTWQTSAPAKPEAHAKPQAERNTLQAMLRGLRHRCPNCGIGKLYTSYLKVADRCPNCGEELFHHRADDAPPYFVMLITGHVLVGSVLSLEKWISPPTWAYAVVLGPLVLLLVLTLLPRVKGALVGLQWALRMHGFDPEAAEMDDAGLRPVDSAS